MHTRWMHCAGMIAFVLSAWGGGAVASESDQPFVMDTANRRDPFTFTQSLPTILTPAPPPPPPAPPVYSFDVAAARDELRQLYSSAENAFVDTNWSGALKACDQALAVLRSVPNEVRDKFSREETDVFRLRTAADRLVLRAEAQRQFEALNISLTGVVARDGSAQAIVNSKIVARGAVVPIPNAPQDVVVLEIRPNEVVFLYRGFHMTVAIKDGDK